MVESTRARRLRSDFRAMERLRAESSIIDFDFERDPPTKYLVTFRGAGFYRQENSNDVLIRDIHEVKIELNAAYPRMIPDLAWQTPIFHPNISASGVVCLGGYSTHWAPSLKLDQLCVMLWDMIRYKNFDVESPYNREAAIWTKAALVDFPVDHRELRDRLTGEAPILNPTKPPSIEHAELDVPDSSRASGETRYGGDSRESSRRENRSTNEAPDMVFLDSSDRPTEVVDAEIIAPGDSDIMFID